MFLKGKTEAAADLTRPDLRGVRIIFVISSFTLGGAERQALLLARHLAHEQFADVEFWGVGQPGRVTELCDDYHIRWRAAPIPLPWSSGPVTRVRRLVSFARALRRARPDVILPFMFFPSIVCGLVWRLTGARMCIWNQRDEGRDRVGQPAEKLATSLMSHFVANSGLGAEFMAGKLGINQAAINVIYNGVELRAPDWDRARWRQHLGVNENCLLACMVANLHEFKDHLTLLKAWRIVVDRMNSEVVLLLAGGSYGTELSLKAQAYDLKLGKSVRFLGGVKDVSGLLGAVDFGIHSSVNEGVPNGVLECMAAGLAVAGTDYPGIREAVGEPGYGFLAPPFDAEALAERIIALASNAELRREAGAANRLRIETEFPPHKMHQKMVSLIAEGLNGGSAQAVATERG
jgi:glycosyltransferase involved in cell wall biosynthesis